ncbi:MULTISPECIES: GNAT family N-acetyltransferase [unclassified Flavobacterium]|uniref:GNAT family N-acetyltransferase n=1 Tax=unclassified Flavobacterium TaxID=196869 RepID=UPI001F12D5FE|nr:MULTISPECIES: GNAT family N-acetyltransferase [unclassified Flavobacterium]UMY64625.1 GNAT family N-acetyltransferase [Flavobacterium sp. HJ-32-4]
MLRIALPSDIPQIQIVRNSVRENTLSDPRLVTDEDCLRFISQRGKGWVYEVDRRIVGFAIADLQDQNIWALFVDPDFERRGIGKELHDNMLDWYFRQGVASVWLGTAPGTRAEQFYKRAGWRQNGLYGKEIRFEMTVEEWQKSKEERNNS